MSAKTFLQIHEPEFDGNFIRCTCTVGAEQFCSSYRFSDIPRTIEPALAQLLVQWLAIVSTFGLFNIDYFDEIICDFPVSAGDAAFFEKLIFKGFGEFRLVNHIPLGKQTTIRGSGNVSRELAYSRFEFNDRGPLLLNGGGKDGSVAASLLTKAGMEFTWFQRGNSAAQANVATIWQRPVVTIRRQLDPNRNNRQYGGHRPIGASIAFLAILSACQFGYSDVIASNESSANEGNLTRDGVSVNHQYSKSFEFEQDFQKLLADSSVPARYFSLLRPLNELQISMLATKLTHEQLAAITSCNNGTKNATWCMDCAKCAFVVLVMTAASPAAAQAIWKDHSIVNHPGLRKYLIELLDPAVDKPLECVGTLAECQLAAHLILRHAGDLLNPATRTLLELYATQRDTSLDNTILHEIGPNMIPGDYRRALHKMREMIGDLRT